MAEDVMQKSVQVGLLLLAAASDVLAQQPIAFQYFYDDLNQLAKVVDSTGVVIQYVYDSVGNILQINRSTAAAGTLSIFNVTPLTVATGGTIAIQGQGFSATPSLNMVMIGGVAVTVVSATATLLVVAVPANAVSGPIVVRVGNATATSPTNETIILAPIISSVTPHAALAGGTASVVVNGQNLTGSTFTFAPTGGSALLVSSAAINANGTSATLSVLAAANANGRFAVVAISSGGVNSGLSVTAGNAFGVFSDPNQDADNDGLANGLELLLGTDPFNPDSDGDGFSDGVEVASGSDPLNSACTPVNCRVPGGETDSVNISALNKAVPVDSFNESDSIIFSLLDLANPTSVMSEADSVAFSVVNAANPVSVLNEADSLTFSVCNGASGPCSGFTSSSRPLLPAAGPQERGLSVSAESADHRGTETTVPTVVAVTPGPRVSGLAASAPVTLVFSEPMDADTLGATNLQLRVGSEVLETSITLSSDFRTATLIAALPPETEITIAVTTGAESLFGVALEEFRSQFRTAAHDHQPATIRQFPVSGAGGVPPESSILLETETSREASTAAGALRVAQNGESVPGTARLEGGTTRFEPAVPLPAGAAVTVSIPQESDDTAVNALAGYSGVFVVAGAANTAPTPVRAYPGKFLSVALNPVIEVEFDRPLDPSTLTVDNVSLHLASDGRPIPSSVRLRGDRIIRLTPYGTLTLHTGYYYEVSARVRDVTGITAGRALRRFFQTSIDFGDTTAAVRETLPRDESRNVDAESPIVVRFEKALNPISVTPDTIRLSANQRGSLPTSISFGEDFREVILMPLEPMPANARITVTVSGIEDTSGNIISPRVTQFSTGGVRSANARR